MGPDERGPEEEERALLRFIGGGSPEKRLAGGSAFTEETQEKSFIKTLHHTFPPLATLLAVQLCTPKQDKNENTPFREFIDHVRQIRLYERPHWTWSPPHYR